MIEWSQIETDLTAELDLPRALRHVAKGGGAPPDIFNSKRVKELILEQRRAAQAAQQQAELQSQQAENFAKVASAVDVNRGAVAS
jgi:hypothetical protein